MKAGNNFIIAGGGTGGHIFPAIAIANAIKSIAPESKFLFIGAKGKMEMEKIPQAGFDVLGLSISGFDRGSLIKNIGLPFKMMKSFLQVFAIFKKFQPDAVLGVGGYSTFPVLKYAQFKNIPTFIHEANSFAGKSNILLGKRASMIFTATDGMDRFFPKNKIVISGNPVRSIIAENSISRNEAEQYFGLHQNKKTILVVGGSLGAKSINEAISKDIDLFQKNNMQLIWQTGKSYVDKARTIAAGYDNIYVSDFIGKMDYAYSASDIVISRSGAMSIAELCIVKKPVVFVPFPYAAENHQMVNAKKLEEKNAGWIVEDKNAYDQLVPLVIQLSKDQVQQKKMSDNIEKLAIKNADVFIAKEILNHLN